MITKELMGWISLIIAVVSYVPYMVSIVRGKTKPHAFSWIVWTIVLGITFAAQYADLAGPGAWATGVSAALCLPICIMALIWGERNITRGDWASFLGALMAIPLWIFTKDAFWAVLLVTFIDGVAYFPTIRKSWTKPNEELAFKYVLTVMKFVFSLVALENISFITTLYPIVSILLEAVVVGVLISRRATLSRLQMA